MWGRFVYKEAWRQCALKILIGNTEGKIPLRRSTMKIYLKWLMMLMDSTG